MKKDFLSIFDNLKPIIGMLHLKGDTESQVIKQAYKEAYIMTENGVDAVIVENYFGTPKNVVAVLEEFYHNNVPFIYGVNLLDNDEENFKLAIKYHAAFLQIDSVAGHLLPSEDKKYGEFINKWRSEYSGAVIGGVRFKYQPYLSGRTLEEDLRFGKSRCDAIAVTGMGTGMHTELSKILEFRNIVGDFPLLVAAGVTAESSIEQLKYADGAIVGSYFKDLHEAEGDVNLDNVKSLMSAVREIRKEYI